MVLSKESLENEKKGDFWSTGGLKEGGRDVEGATQIYSCIPDAVCQRNVRQR